MLAIPGNRQTFCDGMPRRTFLKIGGLALGGIGLTDVLRAEVEQGIGSSHKAIIMVFLPGGPPHQDMWEIKTKAPLEIRGEFHPISTSVPGIQICEHAPRLAAMMEKLVVVRSLVGSRNEHASHICMCGLPESIAEARNHPSLGAVLSKLHGPVGRSVPPFVGLAPQNMRFVGWKNPGRPGFLGPAHAAFLPQSQGMRDMVLKGITLDRLTDRQALLHSIDCLRRDVDAAGVIDAADKYTQQAFEVLASRKLVDALDLEKEDPRVRERYGQGSLDNVVDAAPMYNEHFLMARRLVEAGVRCVTLAFGRWDTHAGAKSDKISNFAQLRDYLPRLDQALSALIQDLHDRGMEQDVSVVVWGEFGRTPKINERGGRDHWPAVSCALLAGGGMPTGQAIGATNRLGEVPQSRPVHYQEIFATLYHNLGIDVGKTTVVDYQGQPHYLTDGHMPMRELV